MATTQAEGQAQEMAQITNTVTVSQNRENIYLLPAYDVFDGSRFLGTVIWNGEAWHVILRGTTVPAAGVRFTARMSAIEYVARA